MSDGNNIMLYMKPQMLQLGDMVVDNNDHASVSDITEAEVIDPAHLLDVLQEEDGDDEYVMKDNIRFALTGNVGVDAEVKSTVSSLTTDCYPSYNELQKKYTRGPSWEGDENDVENPAVIQNTDDQKGLPWYSRESRTSLSDRSQDEKKSPTTHRSNSQSDTISGRSSGFLSYVASQYNGSKKSIVVTLVVFCIVLIASATSLSVGVSHENADSRSEPSANDPSDPIAPGEVPVDEALQLEGQRMPTGTPKGSKSSKIEVQLASTNGPMENVHTLTIASELEFISNNDATEENQSRANSTDSDASLFDDDFVNSTSTATPTTNVPVQRPSNHHPSNGAKTGSPVTFDTNMVRTTRPSYRSASKPNESTTRPPTYAPFEAEVFQAPSIPTHTLFELSTIEPSILIAEKSTLPPSREPSTYHVLPPSNRPTLGQSPDPTSEPSKHSTDKPSKAPSPTPLLSRHPSNQPTLEHTPRPTTPYPSDKPTPDPSQNPSGATPRPTPYPSGHPTPKPSRSPSKAPITPHPSPYPSEAPVTPRPTPLPSQEPITFAPTLDPTPQPTPSPTERSITLSPTLEPAPLPTPFPSMEPVTPPPTPREPTQMPTDPPLTAVTETPTPAPTGFVSTPSPTFKTSYNLTETPTHHE